ncbi:MAG: hypothetical protein J3R72DRAFT_461514 [Linnemannia gamsii]|nr:MAG: hypothetical protein J3R72DRAFT_461514 [Linnemannia gamsii]
MMMNPRTAYQACLLFRLLQPRQATIQSEVHSESIGPRTTPYVKIKTRALSPHSFVHLMYAIMGTSCVILCM